MECPRCGNSYPMMSPRLFLGEKEERLAHNFCPTIDEKTGKIIEVCMGCKMTEVKANKDWNQPQLNLNGSPR